MSNKERFKYWYVPETDPIWGDMHKYDLDHEIFMTASVAQQIFGLDTSSSAHRVYQYYHKNRTPENIDEDPAIVYGKKNESVALKQFYQCMPHLVGIKPGLIKHPTIPWFGASLDNVAVDIRTGELINVEVKCRYWGFIPHPKDFLTKWYCQIQHQMMCVPAISKSYLVAWKDYSMAVYEVKRDELCQKELPAVLDEFHTAVVEKEPPAKGYYKSWGQSLFTNPKVELIYSTNCNSPNLELKVVKEVKGVKVKRTTKPVVRKSRMLYG